MGLSAVTEGRVGSGIVGEVAQSRERDRWHHNLIFPLSEVGVGDGEDGHAAMTASRNKFGRRHSKRRIRGHGDKRERERCCVGQLDRGQKLLFVGGGGLR